ncbi:MAG TPA: response regulator [Propionibacteriaceae bacterium]
MTFRVLVVEDEAFAAEAHAAYVGRLPAFELAGVARSARDATRLLQADPDVDLLLLDLHLPDGHGLQLLRHLRAAGQLCDVIAVTSARDLDVVRQAVSQGVVSYLLKPFTFAGFRAKLEQYASYRESLAAQSASLAQAEVDAAFALLRPAGAPDLPKGLSLSTLRLVTGCLQETAGAASASEVAQRAGTSRVTARRYLEHLVGARLADRETRFGGSGRPEVEYRWRG